MELTKSIVAIYASQQNASKEFSGTGFFVTNSKGETVILTCAHVLGADKKAGDLVYFRIEGTDQVRGGKILAFSPPENFDMAVIQPSSPVTDFPSLPYAQARDSKGNPFSTFGYPQPGNLTGLHGVGQVLGLVKDKQGRQFLQLSSKQMTHGYSGAPIWDDERGVVVGMIVSGFRGLEGGALDETCFAIPVESMQIVYPDLAPQPAKKPAPPKDKRLLRVFISHAPEHLADAREMYAKLAGEGWIDPWLDDEKLLPGQDWDMEIEQAVERADAVLVFISKSSVAQEGYVQKELRYVLKAAQKMPEGVVFVIPVRLDDCPMPYRLRDWRAVDYFPAGQRDGTYKRILMALEARKKSLS